MRKARRKNTLDMHGDLYDFALGNARPYSWARDRRAHFGAGRGQVPILFGTGFAGKADAYANEKVAKI